MSSTLSEEALRVFTLLGIVHNGLLFSNAASSVRCPEPASVGVTMVVRDGAAASPTTSNVATWTSTASIVTLERACQQQPAPCEEDDEWISVPLGPTATLFESDTDMPPRQGAAGLGPKDTPSTSDGLPKSVPDLSTETFVCQFCRLTMQGERFPFAYCRSCGDSPSWHHGRCCPLKRVVQIRDRVNRCHREQSSPCSVGAAPCHATVNITISRQ